MTTTPSRLDFAPREFHISRLARSRYEIPDAFFSLTGNIVLVDFRQARRLAHAINLRRERGDFSERPVQASELYAIGLIDEVLHLLISRHRQLVAPKMMTDALARLEKELGDDSVARLLTTFVEHFPPSAVFRGEETEAEYLAGASDGVDHREVVLEEALMVWLANRNPAFAPFRELFDDHGLRESSLYVSAMESLETFLTTIPGRAPTAEEVGDADSLLTLLYAPMRSAPDSLEGQLRFIRTYWSGLLGFDLYRLLGGLDFLAEEQRVFFAPGPGPIEAPDLAAYGADPENYSADRDWMPRLVLLAKNAPVWLAQLSDRYGRAVTTLSDIPDVELAQLAEAGFTGLWLIGVWERSPASKRIKRRMGDEDAVASAYSLAAYRVAEELGGDEAFDQLKERAWRFGIRLSTDMVPNHMGIDSRWIIEHPDWFLSLEHSPFPSYSFSGPDLSDDDRVGVFIEDHYWDRSDAAVVFRRLDRATGDERFIYHGNDGTSMPWNDTAQLDYRKPEVREAVIQTILGVARRSPVIRFDAAMTLTKQHYQRLWFPEPGTAGAIPSRAEHGMTRSAFDAVMPAEFWREVVDRVAAEAPDTLLLAEAFWLLEGYFVRTLGMHRVYNSAFMNMLRDERNAEFRQMIRSTLEFDPRILKRYVNFMSNPDEETAVEQFGTDDKYFGVATLMATLPGLPMFAHGQIEGLAEKYGMEFQRPRWHETPNEGLVRRHELQIFPLLRRRWSFAEVDCFLLYDLISFDGSVDENVIAYSNRVGDQRSLVIYHNRFAETSGRLQTSTPITCSNAEGAMELARTDLADGLALSGDLSSWVVWRDLTTGLEHIRSHGDVRRSGLAVNLAAYELHVFVDIREIGAADDRPVAALAESLQGRGVPSIDEALTRLALADLLEPLERLLRSSELHDLAVDPIDDAARQAFEETVRDTVSALLGAATRRVGGDTNLPTLSQRMLREIRALASIADRGLTWQSSGSKRVRHSGRFVVDSLVSRPDRWVLLLTWIVCRRLGELEGTDPKSIRARERAVEWRLANAATEALSILGLPDRESRQVADTIDQLLAIENKISATRDPDQAARKTVESLLENAAGQRTLGVNRFDDTEWFNREAFLETVVLLALIAAVELMAGDSDEGDVGALWIDQFTTKLQAACESSGYRVDALIDLLRQTADSGTTER